MEKQIVGPGKLVAYSYKLYNDEDGKLLFETPDNAPDVLIYGYSEGIVPGLLTAIEGLSVGDKFEITLPPVAAFGEKNPDLLMELDKVLFERDGKLASEVKIGAALPMMTAEGFRVEGKVVDISVDKVKMDFNHPFAGLTVRYEGIIDEVRDATPEEMQPSCGCGGGCCGGCGGNDSEGCGGQGCGASCSAE